MTEHEADRRRAGLGLAILSASGFASLAVFGKQAYDAGFDTTQVLAIRFSLGAPVLMLIAFAGGRSLRLPLAAAARVFALGAVGYAVQATLFFTALSRISASLTGLLLYLYPALVTIGAVLLGRHRATRLTVVGLALAVSGTVLILGLPAGRIDAVGVAFALASAFWYAGYILVGEHVADDVDALVTGAYVSAGAAASFVLVGGGVLGGLDFDGVDWAAGAFPLIGIAVFATAVAIAAFFGGMALIGSTWASITSSWEPVCTVVLSVIFLGEELAFGIVVGGAMVVVGAVVLPLVGGDREVAEQV